MAEFSTSNVDREYQTDDCRRKSVRRKRARTFPDFEEIETESPVSINDEEEVLHPVRGRGRGKTRGRGRGGRRGGRVSRGRQFEEDEEEHLVRLHKERQEAANAMIDDLTEPESKAILKEVSNRQPSLILDIAKTLSNRQHGQPSDQGAPGPAGQQPSWCVCTKCPPMDRDEDQVCCGMAPQYCNSIRPEMGLVITDPLTLHLQQVFRNDVFVQQAADMEDTNKGMRHAAYRQYILWIFGRLEKDDRRTVPACCVRVIREKYPSPSGHYTGFIPAQHGIGW